jgi:hypothetical protein
MSNRRRRALSAKARAKRDKKADEKRATALAKIASTKELAETLVAQLKKIVDEAETSMIASIREATELAFRLQDECRFTQLKIATAIGRSQGWVSLLLAWRERGYKGTPSIHAPAAPPKLLAANNPAVQPDPKVGMPGGPKLVLLPDNAIVVEELKAGHAPSTLIHNGVAHPDKGAPMSTKPKSNGKGGDNTAQKDAALTSFARLVSDLFSLMAGGVKPIKFVRADVTNETLMKVAGLCTGVVEAREQAERLARVHNETAEQSAEAMKAKHAASEAAAAASA